MAASGAPGVRLRVLGPLTAQTDTGTLSGSELGSRKARQLLLLLAGSHGQAVPADVVVDRLWGDAQPANARRVADALLEELGREVAYRPVETDGAARVADHLAELV